MNRTYKDETYEWCITDSIPPTDYEWEKVDGQKEGNPLIYLFSIVGFSVWRRRL